MSAKRIVFGRGAREGLLQGTNVASLLLATEAASAERTEI
jgi:hypothetical protein